MTYSGTVLIQSFCGNRSSCSETVGDGTHTMEDARVSCKLKKVM